MSWVTLISSMIASACLTLAVMSLVVWWKNRSAWAHLLFSVTALSTTAFAFCELWIMRSATPEELLLAVTWSHVPLFFLLVSITWFVRIYLDAGRTWLAWTITGLRALSLMAILLLGPGASAPFDQFVALLVLLFIADASVMAWRRGDRRKAMTVGGSAEFFLIASLSTAIAVVWGNVRVPIVFSVYYMGLVVTLGYELSRDLFRASQLVRELQVNNNQISDLCGRLMSAQETERTRIARELHDDVSQRIAGLSIKMSDINRRVQRRPADIDIVDALASLQQDTYALAEEIRHLSHDLHPSQLQHTGLAAALGAFCAECERRHAITVVCDASPDVDGDVDDLATALCLYRITQEALQNVAKHAGAHRAVVELTRETDGVHLTIIDDGIGFDLAASRGRNAGLGLVSIDERVRLLRGSVCIDTQPGHGTRLQIHIPRSARSIPAAALAG